TEINVAYSGPKRHHHNLQHLEFMFYEFDLVEDQVNDKISFQLAIFYHDLVYNVKKKDNEEKSADLAFEQLLEMGYPAEKCNFVKSMIQATKRHEISANQDINLLLDIDMAVLGMDWVSYFKYTQHIRKEYKIYPEFIYRKGRREILNHFLEMDHLFKTKFYRDKFEEQARKNIAQELDLL